VIIVTHELASIYAIATNSVFLDSEAKTMLATGDPKRILRESDNPTVVNFLSRGTGQREVRQV
jgi:phospholipid/cholesterol/gamma-HCH transport system ATP-binding protein